MSRVKDREKAEADLRQQKKAHYDRAIDFAEERMRQHTEADLEQAFEAISKGAKSTQKIRPVCHALTRRYLDDRACLFSGKVHSELRDENGVKDDDATKELAEADEKAKYFEVMEHVERVGLLLRSCGVQYQSIGKTLSPTIFYPQNIIPIEPEQGQPFNRVDAETYEAYVLNLEADTDGTERDSQMWATVTKDKTVIHESKKPTEIENTIRTVQNEYGNFFPLRIWHPLFPSEYILPESDVSIVEANRELNLQWSYINHLIRAQGGSVLIRSSDTGTELETEVMMSPVHPYETSLGESASFANPNVNWNGLVDTIQAGLKSWGNLHGMVPGDFELDPRAVQSGIAKIIESIPKIEAKEKLKTYAEQQERREWKDRRRAVYLSHGLITAKRAGREDLTLHTTFETKAIPKSIDELTKELDFDLKHNITTPAAILAKREGITTEEAQQKIDEYSSANKTGARGSLADLIGAPGLKKEEEPEEDEGEADDDLQQEGS